MRKEQNSRELRPVGNSIERNEDETHEIAVNKKACDSLTKLSR